MTVLRGEALDLRTVSRAALFSALGLAFPVLFHLVRLGSVFLPMYLPLLAGAFLLPVGWAIAIGVATPLISAVATGMPPFFPPVAAWMAVELGVTCGIVSLLRRRMLPKVVVLVAVLMLGRAVYLGLVYATSAWLRLPAGLLTVTSLLAGWPGVVLALLAVPPAVAAVERRWPVGEVAP